MRAISPPSPSMPFRPSASLADIHHLLAPASDPARPFVRQLWPHKAFSLGLCTAPASQRARLDAFSATKSKKTEKARWSDDTQGSRGLGVQGGESNWDRAGGGLQFWTAGPAGGLGFAIQKSPARGQGALRSAKPSLSQKLLALFVVHCWAGLGW